MKLSQQPPEAEFDDIDLHILTLLQENCKLPLAKIGEKVGLSAPSVIDRIKKLEDQRVIMGYRAVVDARRVGKDVTAFIGVSVSHPKLIGEFEQEIQKKNDELSKDFDQMLPAVLKEIAKKDKISLVLNKSISVAPKTDIPAVLYADEGLDLTERAVAEMDKKSGDKK